MNPFTITEDPAIVKLRQLYLRVPKIECRKKCSESCGPIAMSKVEWERICERLGEIPAGTPDLTCPMLNNEQLCSVYAIRPMICRLWGVVKEMACPWGCEPERWLTDREARQLLSEADKLEWGK